MNGVKTLAANRKVQALTVMGPICSVAVLYAAYCPAHMAFTRTSKPTSAIVRAETVK
jgi:hypothetical protein